MCTHIIYYIYSLSSWCLEIAILGLAGWCQCDRLRYRAGQAWQPKGGHSVHACHCQWSHSESSAGKVVRVVSLALLCEADKNCSWTDWFSCYSSLSVWIVQFSHPWCFSFFSIMIDLCIFFSNLKTLCLICASFYDGLCMTMDICDCAHTCTDIICDPASRNEFHGYFLRFWDFCSIVITN